MGTDSGQGFFLPLDNVIQIIWSFCPRLLTDWCWRPCDPILYTIRFPNTYHIAYDIHSYGTHDRTTDQCLHLATFYHYREKNIVHGFFTRFRCTIIFLNFTDSTLQFLCTFLLILSVKMGIVTDFSFVNLSVTINNIL